MPFLSHSSLFAMQALKEQEAGIPRTGLLSRAQFDNKHKHTRWNMADSSVDLVGVNTEHIIE